MDQIAKAITSVAVRIIGRYLVAAFVALGLGTAALGESLVGSPQVQALITAFVGGLIAFLIERATVLARRYGTPT